MVTVSARELKNKTGRILRLVGEGLVVLIAKNRKPLAKVMPLTGADLEHMNLRPFALAWQEIEGSLRASMLPYPVQGILVCICFLFRLRSLWIS